MDSNGLVERGNSTDLAKRRDNIREMWITGGYSGQQWIRREKEFNSYGKEERQYERDVDKRT